MGNIEIVQRSVAQIPWRNNISLPYKIKYHLPPIEEIKKELSVRVAIPSCLGSTNS